MVENRAVNISIIFIAIVVLGIVLKTFESFLRPFAIALILTFLLMPLIRWSRKKKIPFSVSIIAVVLILVIFMGLIVGLLAREVSKMSKTLPEQQEKIDNLIDNTQAILTDFEVYGEKIDLKTVIDPQKVGEIVSSILKSILHTAGAIISELFLAILFVIFLLPSHELMIRNIDKGLDGHVSKKFKSVLLKTEGSIKTYLYTKSLVSFGTAFVSALLLLVFGADFVFILALTIFIMNFIPNIGSIIAVGIAAFSHFLTVGFGLELVALGVLLIIVQMVFGNIIDPKITGQKLKLSPIVILMSLFIWYWVWGIVGMMLAVPITSIIKIIMDHIESTRRYTSYLT
ncbi:AI-2E family transporter [Thermoproteota archaeon]